MNDIYNVNNNFFSNFIIFFNSNNLIFHIFLFQIQFLKSIFGLKPLR